jgi:hypothetical protein
MPHACLARFESAAFELCGSHPQIERARVFHPALLAPAGGKADAPSHPMSPNHVRLQHIRRVHEASGRNVSETARRLNMHRRTLQRILSRQARKKETRLPKYEQLGSQADQRSNRISSGTGPDQP